MKIYIFIGLVFFCSLNVLSQDYLNYYKLINRAEIETLNKEFKQADIFFKQAFKSVPKPFKEDYFLAALSIDNLKKDSLVYDYLIEGIKQGLTFKRISRQNFYHFKKSKLYKVLKKNYKKYHQNYLDSIDQDLMMEISKMIKNDQKARKPIFGSSKKMKKVDSYNFKRLLEIIKENDKWPGFSVIGENTPKGKYDVTGNITLMLLHFKKKQIEELKPFMLKAVLEGEMYPYHYARVIDYTIGLPKKSCQIFGTYLDGGILIKICDCNKAEEKRKKIGFESLEDYYRKRNSKFKCSKN